MHFTLAPSHAFISRPLDEQRITIEVAALITRHKACRPLHNTAIQFLIIFNKRLCEQGVAWIFQINNFLYTNLIKLNSFTH